MGQDTTGILIVFFTTVPNVMSQTLESFVEKQMDENWYSEEEVKDIFRKASVSLVTKKSKEFFELLNFMLRTKMPQPFTYSKITIENIREYEKLKEEMVEELKKLSKEHPKKFVKDRK